MSEEGLVLNVDRVLPLSLLLSGGIVEGVELRRTGRLALVDAFISDRSLWSFAQFLSHQSQEGCMMLHTHVSSASLGCFCSSLCFGEGVLIQEVLDGEGEGEDEVGAIDQCELDVAKRKKDLSQDWDERGGRVDSIDNEGDPYPF